VPYHVEIRRSYRRAWAFNLSAEKLHRTIVGPWLGDRPIELGDREWEPRECRLRILDGPELPPQDLAFGQGWSNAERSGRDVAVELLRKVAPARAGIAVVAATGADRAAIVSALRAIGTEPGELAPLREWLVRGAHPEMQPNAGAIAVVAVSADQGPEWLFEAGLAIGAFGRRALVVRLGGAAPPAALAELDPLSLDPADPGTLAAFAERLRRAAA
jgi:hypothetical protein